MKQQPTWRLSRRTWLQSALSVLAAPLAGCGGAELVALIPGVGTGGTGVVAGILTGLGSLIVDGQKYDESQATLLGADGGETTVSTFQVGHVVEMTLDKDEKPIRVSLMPQLIGRLQQVLDGGLSLLVMGQQVNINLDSNQGVVTVFSGCNVSQLLQLLDKGLRVYGDLVANADTDVLYASRIEYLGSDETSPTHLTATLRAESGVYRLGQQVLDVPAHLAATWQTWVGQMVTATGPWPVSNALDAVWQPAALQPKNLTSSTELPRCKMNGRMSYRVADGAWYLQGQSIDMRQIDNSSQFDDKYVSAVVESGGDGRWIAQDVKFVTVSDRVLRVSGAIESFIDNTSFVVRGLPVNAAEAGQLGSALANGRYVTVTGRIRDGVLLAVTVETLDSTALPDRAVLMLQGTVEADAKTIRCDGSDQVFKLQSNVALQPGQRIGLEGYWDRVEGAVMVRGEPVALLESDDENVIPISGVLDAVDKEKGLFINGRWIEVDAEEWDKWSSEWQQGRSIVQLQVLKMESGPLKAKPKLPVK